MTPILKISSDLDGKRLDVVLARAYPDYSRAFLQKWIKDGKVTLSGKELDVPNYRVKAGESIEVVEFKAVTPAGRKPGPSDFEATGSRPEACRDDVKVIYEDDSLLVLNKPMGLVVHPAPSHKGATLVDWLEQYLGPKVTGLFHDSTRLGVVHRLDKDTTGVLLVAKTVSAQNALGKQFQDRKIQKTYAAFIEGTPEAESGIISAPVGRSHRVPSRMAVSSSGRPSETSFEVIKRFKEVSQVSLHPKTGRTHQIRVHCAAIGHPIVGDVAYGSSLRWAKDFGIHRPLLHAESLQFQHPVTRKKVRFEAPWAPDMKKALKLFAVAALFVSFAPWVHAETETSPRTTKAKPNPQRAVGTTQGLKREMSSLQNQFKALIEEVSAIQDRVSGLQSSLDQQDASRRLRDLEKAISDLNGKSVTTASVAEETKTQSLDLANKLRGQQDLLDQLRDQVDRLQREMISLKSRAESAPPTAERGRDGTAK